MAYPLAINVGVWEGGWHVFGVKLYLIGLRSSTLAWVLLPSEAGGRRVTWTSRCPIGSGQMGSRERWRASLLLWSRATGNLAYMWLKHCSVLWDLQIVHVTHTFWFFGCLKRVGGVLSRSELDSFVCSVMKFRSKTSLAPVLHLCRLIKSESSSSKDVLWQFWVEADPMVLGIKMYQY